MLMAGSGVMEEWESSADGHIRLMLFFEIWKTEKNRRQFGEREGERESFNACCIIPK